MAAQLPDVIIVHGEKMELYSNPLEQYWIENKVRRPAFQSTIICKRGYIATWELRGKLLLLRDIDGDYENSHFIFWKKIEPYTFNQLFPKADGEAIATWFTGKIRIPQGRRTLYVHHEYDSRFEREMVVTIEHGRVMKTVVLDYAKHELHLEQ